jgi:hypothetical protein
MKRTLHNIILAIFGAVTVAVTAQDQQPLSLLEALPVGEAVGPGWKREISLLFDAASKPAEIIDSRSVITDSRKKAEREAVENPTNPVSGRAHAHFDFKGERHSNRYEVQVERYRDKERAVKDLNALAGADQKEYQMKDITGIGDAAVLVSGASGTPLQGTTLYFRRGTYRISISALFGTNSWEDDISFRQLARVFDEPLAAKLVRKNN